MLMPNKPAAIMKIAKLLALSAKAASNTDKTEQSDAIAKPSLRPTLFIRTVAGIVVAATAKTMIEIGKVANAGFCVSLEPMMPPRVTRTIAPVAEIS